MDVIEEFLSKQDKIIAEDRAKILISLGLTEREYAPDNKESREYPKYAYKDGEKHYYRDVAIKVTDEQWEEIIKKAKAVEEIQMREECERQKKHTQAQGKPIKKWIPIFQKPKDEFSSEGEEETGKSKIATKLRIVAWLLGIITVIGGFIAGKFLLILISFAVCGLELLMFYALASILDYLAELTAIAKSGIKYTESNK